MKKTGIYVPICSDGGLEHRVFELLAVGCRIHDEDGHKKQSLIAGLEILQRQRLNLAGRLREVLTKCALTAGDGSQLTLTVSVNN